MDSSSSGTNTTTRDNMINSGNTTAVNSNNTTDNRRKYEHSKHIEVKDSTVHIRDTSPKPRTRTRKELEKLVEAEIDWDTLSGQLSVADQDKHRSTISLLDRKEPKYFWITKNIDFTQWESDEDSKALWLSGPHDRGMKEVSSHIISVAKEKPNSSVLYFFCSTATTRGSVATVFAHTLLQQIVRSSSADKAKAIAATFIKSLLGIRRNMSRFKENDSLSTTVETILDVPDNELHRALVEATRTAEIQELSIIIDGIDITEPEGVMFVQIVYSLVKQMMDAVSKFKALLTSSQNPKLKEIFGELLCIEHDKERKDCLDFLPHDDTRYGKVLDQHEGSLEWLWKHAQYQQWSTSKSSSLLFVEGKPGSGKSTLVKYFKENLTDKEPNARSSTVAHYFYTHRGTQLESTHENMLRSILYHILEQDESIFFDLQREFREVHHGNISKWPYESLKNTLSSFANLPSTKPIYLILDAMDESEEGDRRDIIKLLCNLCSKENRCHIKVFLASRPVAELQRHIGKHHHLIKLQDENKDDISKFAGNFLSDDLMLTGSDLAKARDYINNNARGVFVWVALVKKELSTYFDTGYREEEILKYLTSLPKELQGFYKLMLDRLESGTNRDIQDGQKIFRWVLFGFRPLTVVELCHALAVPDERSLMVSYEEFRRREVRGMEKRIMHCGGNFLEINSDGTVQLMHQTVREFLLQTIKDVTDSNLLTTDEDAHTAIITTSVQYLMLCFSICPTMRDRFSKIESWGSEDFQEYVRYLDQWPLLNYTLSSLNSHHGYCGPNESVSHLISTLIDQLTLNQASCFLGAWVDSYFGKTKNVRSSPQNNILSRMRIIRRDQTVPVYKHPVAAEDFRYNALDAAAADGLSQLVDTLLISCSKDGCSAQINTLLIITAGKGLKYISQLFLDRRADPIAKDRFGQTALHHAAKNGHEAVAQLLLQHGARREAKDNKGRTALRLAILKFPHDNRGRRIYDYRHHRYLYGLRRDGDLVYVRYYDGLRGVHIDRYDGLRLDCIVYYGG